METLEQRLRTHILADLAQYNEVRRMFYGAYLPMLWLRVVA